MAAEASRFRPLGPDARPTRMSSLRPLPGPPGGAGSSPPSRPSAAGTPPSPRWAPTPAGPRLSPAPRAGRWLDSPPHPASPLRPTRRLDLPPLRPARPRRSRRAEAGLVVVALLGLAWLGQALWGPRFTPAGSGRPAAQLAPGAPAPPAPLSPAARAGISFSFAKFEADPALVAGAASTGAPSLSGDSAIVVDLGTRDVLYAKQPHKRQLMASTAKIMTAIVTAEHGPLDKVITIPEEATQVEPNHMGVRAGEQLTVQELLYGLLLDSGNDAGEALAYGVGGGGPAGRAQFVAWMNETVAALGLQGTHYVNPSGLDDPDQYSTAYDLAVMGAYALTKPALRRVFATREVVIESSREAGHEHGWYHPGNLNSLLTTYRGAVGIKPGYTEDAGYTLVGAAEREGRTLVCVTLNSRHHFSDCAALLDFGFARPAPATS